MRLMPSGSLTLVTFVQFPKSPGAMSRTGYVVFPFGPSGPIRAGTVMSPLQMSLALESQNPGVEIVFNFGASGTLKTQIEEGADEDVFISAGQKQMNQLDIEADPKINTDELDFVLPETRFNILENKVALAVPEGNPAGIESYDDWAEKLGAGEIFMAMGNEDVPVGQYTQKILAYYELDETELADAGSITYGSNVKEVTTQVSEGTVDCGIIYQTDAFSAELEIVDTATADMCGQVIYPAAVMHVSRNPELAQAFLDFCVTEEASQIFETVGFTPLTADEPAEEPAA